MTLHINTIFVFFYTCSVSPTFLGIITVFRTIDYIVTIIKLNYVTTIVEFCKILSRLGNNLFSICAALQEAKVAFVSNLIIPLHRYKDTIISKALFSTSFFSRLLSAWNLYIWKGKAKFSDCHINASQTNRLYQEDWNLSHGLFLRCKRGISVFQIPFTKMVK